MTSVRNQEPYHVPTSTHIVLEPRCSNLVSDECQSLLPVNVATKHISGSAAAGRNCTISASKGVDTNTPDSEPNLTHEAEKLSYSNLALTIEPQPRATEVLPTRSSMIYSSATSGVSIPVYHQTQYVISESVNHHQDTITGPLKVNPSISISTAAHSNRSNQTISQKQPHVAKYESPSTQFDEGPTVSLAVNAAMIIDQTHQHATNAMQRAEQAEQKVIEVVTLFNDKMTSIHKAFCAMSEDIAATRETLQSETQLRYQLQVELAHEKQSRQNETNSLQQQINDLNEKLSQFQSIVDANKAELQESIGAANSRISKVESQVETAIINERRERGEQHESILTQLAGHSEALNSCVGELFQLPSKFEACVTDAAQHTSSIMFQMRREFSEKISHLELQQRQNK